MISLEETNDIVNWDSFIDKSSNGTIFHKQKFLNYHGNKFQDGIKNLVWYKGSKICAVMPLFLQEDKGQLVGKSPYGASFGGIIYSRKMKFRHFKDIIHQLKSYLNENEIIKTNITLPPINYNLKLNSYLEYFLSYYGFELISRDVFNVIILDNNYKKVWKNYEGRARTTVRKVSDNFEIIEDVSPEDFFPILSADKKRHDAKPTHSLNDLIYLKNNFPKDVQFDIAVHKSNGGKAGICFFKTNTNTYMTFYISQENKVLKEDGPTVLIDHGIRRAIDERCSYFDFGSSTIGYYIQNSGVARFKEGFGAIGLLRNTYQLRDE